jgi:hypothetical protein
MTYISDFKSSAFALFKQATSTVTGTGAIQPDSTTYVGQRFVTNDGREVVLVQNSTTALTNGVLVQGPTVVANHQGMAVAVPATVPGTAGTFAVSVTTGATVLDVNQYAGGYLIIDSGTGIGQTLRVSSHPAAAASTAGVVIVLEDPIQITLDATSTACLIPNQYTNVVINPSTASGIPVGVTLYPLAATVAATYDGTSGKLVTAGNQQYGFIQTKGIVSCLSDATVAAVGLEVTASTGTNGAITLATTTGPTVGRAVQLGVSAKARAIFVDL